MQAAMEPRTSLLGSGALQLLLQHPLLRKPDLVCRLLCTSKALGAAVATALAGQVPVGFTAGSLEQAKQFGQWVAKYGPLMQSLRVWLDLGDFDDDDVDDDDEMTVLAEAAIAVGLQAAAQSPGGLLLRSLQHLGASSAAGDLLLHLPSSHLTSLWLTCFDPNIISFSNMAAALANLTGLCTLTLYMPPAAPEQLLPSLSVLIHLTHLAIEAGLQDVSGLKHLPASLVELNLWEDDHFFEQPQQPLQLGHLTALTNLQCNEYHLKPDDVLPTNLAVLTLEGCSSAQPMLGLSQLQSLDLSSCPAPEDVVQIGCLPQLKDVDMYIVEDSPYVPLPAADVAAGALRTLPLKDLTVAGGFSVSAIVLQHLGALQGLTDLSFGPFSSPVDAAPSDLAAALRQLNNLNRLQVWRVGFARGADNMKALTQAVASLPRLSSLSWTGIEANSAATVELAAAPALTYLCWMECGLDDFSLNTLAWSSTGLRELCIDDNPKVTDAALPTLARTLSHLTRLSLNCTGVSDVGVECLARLKQLRLSKLDLDGTSVSAATLNGLPKYQG